jgi:hypothetical protein
MSQPPSTQRDSGEPRGPDKLVPLIAGTLTALGEIREDERRRLSHTGRRALELAELELRTLLKMIEHHPSH